MVSVAKLDGIKMEFSLYVYDEGDPKVLIYVGKVSENNLNDIDALKSLLGIKQIHDAQMRAN